MLHTPPPRLHRDGTEEGIRVSVAFLSDIGSVRKNNEDALVVADLAKAERTFANGEMINCLVGDRGLLLCVADGMGGAKAGEVAAQMTVERLPSVLTQDSNQASTIDRLRQALKSVNYDIACAAQKDFERQGMGAAVTAVLVNDRQAVIGQVGDSRGYLIRAGEVHQLTKDQSIVQSMVDAGVLTPTEAASSPYRNVILQALGAAEDVEPAVVEVELEVDDQLVLCTDGLSNKISPEEIRDTLSQPGTLYDSCLSMVDLAKQRGGEDNITVIVAQF